MTSAKEAKALLRLARRAGWEYLGLTGNNHYRIRWPKTGQVLTVPMTPSSPLRNAEADIARISGPLRPKPGRGRSKRERAAARKRRSTAVARVKPVARTRPESLDWRDQLAAVKPILETTHEQDAA